MGRATDDETLDDIAAAKAVGDLDLVLFCGSDVLGANHACELFARGEGDAVDDRYGDDGLEGGETGDGAEDEGAGGWRVRSLAVYGECRAGVGRECACEAGAQLAVLEIDAGSDGGRGRPCHGHWLAWQDERHEHK